MICIAPRARRSAVGFLGFVLPLYTFDVQTAPIHIAKSWSIPPFETPISVLHPISTISPLYLDLETINRFSKLLHRSLN
jgi:hypothetical protein